MHSMNDERFSDLAMKAIARQASDSERAELETLLAGQPALKSEFERLQADVRVAKEVLPLVDATAAAAGQLPAHARGRLQTKVRQTFRRPESAEKVRDRSLAWGWRWWLGLAAATAVVVLLVSVFRSPGGVVIQVAMLDVTGATRGAPDPEQALLGETWKGATVQDFSEASQLATWERAWPDNGKRPVVKIIYDRAAGELRVIGKRDGTFFSETFELENGLASALKPAKEYLEQQMRR